MMEAIYSAIPFAVLGALWIGIATEMKLPCCEWKLNNFYFAGCIWKWWHWRNFLIIDCCVIKSFRDVLQDKLLTSKHPHDSNEIVILFFSLKRKIWKIIHHQFVNEKNKQEAPPNTKTWEATGKKVIIRLNDCFLWLCCF